MIAAERAFERLEHARDERVMIGRCLDRVERAFELDSNFDRITPRRPAQLVVVIATQKKASSAVAQVKRQRQRPGAVGPTIHKVAKLYDKQISRVRLLKGRVENNGVTMHIANDANAFECLPVWL
jgi:hypothetical protein